MPARRRAQPACLGFDGRKECAIFESPRTSLAPLLWGVIACAHEMPAIRS